MDLPKLQILTRNCSSLQSLLMLILLWRTSQPKFYLEEAVNKIYHVFDILKWSWNNSSQGSYDYKYMASILLV
jgi:hypothetical protein